MGRITVSFYFWDYFSACSFLQLFLIHGVQVRQQVIARSLIAKRQRDLRDMVIEDEVPDVG